MRMLGGQGLICVEVAVSVGEHTRIDCRWCEQRKRVLLAVHHVALQGARVVLSMDVSDTMNMACA